jgi:hypothetical protein
VAGAVLVDFGRPGGGGPVPCRGVRPRGAAHGWIHRLVGSCSCVSPLVRLWFPASSGCRGLEGGGGGGGCLARCWVLEERAVPTHASYVCHVLACVARVCGGPVSPGDHSFRKLLGCPCRPRSGGGCGCRGGCGVCGWVSLVS